MRAPSTMCRVQRALGAVGTAKGMVCGAHGVECKRSGKCAAPRALIPSSLAQQHQTQSEVCFTSECLFQACGVPSEPEAPFGPLLLHCERDVMVTMDLLNAYD